MGGLREAVRVPGISEQSHIVLGIGTNLCQTNQIDAVLLYVHASRKIVTISLVIAVIKTVNYRGAREQRINSVLRKKCSHKPANHGVCWRSNCRRMLHQTQQRQWKWRGNCT